VARQASASSVWASQTERGSMSLLRLMAWFSMRLGRRMSRLVLYSVAAYFFLFAPTPRRHARDYLRRVLGRAPTAKDRFRHILSFASTIHDRIFLLNGRFDLFDISIDGEEVMQAARLCGKGALLMGAHLGSFEVTHALGRRQPGLDVAMAMYAANARKINAVLSAINPRFKADIVELGNISAMLEIHARLDAGSFVGILADRTLGNEPTEQAKFLGAPASFPIGPMRIAAMLRRPVYFMAGLYLGGNRYHIIFEKIADFSGATTNDRKAAVSAAIQEYAAAVERCCRAYPYNWFNFFDFWQPDPAAVRIPTGSE